MNNPLEALLVSEGEAVKLSAEYQQAESRLQDRVAGRHYRQALFDIEHAYMASPQRLREIANIVLNRHRKHPRRLQSPPSTGKAL